MALVGRSRSRLAKAKQQKASINPFRIHEYTHGTVESIPDIAEFVVSDRYLNRPNIYPRQMTFLKVIFLQTETFCADEQTEILTRRGWQSYRDVVEGEDVLTLTPEGLSEWAPAERVNVFPVESETLIRMEGYGHSSLTTPNHRWLVERTYSQRDGSSDRRREFVETRNLGARDRISCAAPVINLPSRPKWSDAFVELAAWYWTEGHLRESGAAVISQSLSANPEYVDRIRAALTALIGPESTTRLRKRVPGWGESRRAGGMIAFRVSPAAMGDLRVAIEGSEKVPSADFLTSLTKSQLDLFIETSIDADGTRWEMPSGKIKREITQKSKARLDAFQMACSLAGIRTNLTMRPVRGRGEYRGQEHWHLSLYDHRKYFTPQTRERNFTISEVEHTGHVWCPTTRNGTWLARRDGKVYFTGNTQYDYDVIGEWEEKFLQTGNEGISPGILDRIRINKAQGRKWFRESQGVIGRRGSKGYTGGIAGSYVLWNYMLVPGGPQTYYGIDRDKQLTGIVFAGKKEQAQANQWKDITNVVLGGPCFSPYISRAQVERLTVFAPTDVLRAQRMASNGVQTDADIASFQIIPAPSTTMAARGPTSFMQFYDEQAHVLSSTANADAGEVYQCLDPKTRVLTADLRWVPISDLRVGDRLMSVDEHPPGTAGSPRKIQEAEVLGVGRSRKVSYRITLDDGSSVVSSGLHRWLRATPNDKNFKWATIERPSGPSRWAPLRVGDRIKSLVDPWIEDSSREGGYLAGVFDGEGHVRFDPRKPMRVSFTQKPGSVWDEVTALLSSRGIPFRERHETPSGCSELIIEGISHCLPFLGSVRPLRLMENARHLWQGRAAKGPGMAKTVVSIEEVGVKNLVDIETSTKTFIAEGLVSHNSATPALDQFKKDGFIYAPSSPWAKTGQFYENWELAIEMNPDGTPSYPERLMLQLPSWGPYMDWERAGELPLRPPKVTMIDIGPETSALASEISEASGLSLESVLAEIEDAGGIEQVEADSLGNFQPLKNAIQTYDDDMRQLERANPETFAVERRSHWAESLSAYLNAAKVKEIFAPWRGEQLFCPPAGVLGETYIGRGDPANTNKRFGWAIGHKVWVPSEDPEEAAAGRGRNHVVFDRITCWEPADYPDHLLDYDDVIGDIWEDIKDFMPDDVAFDQFNVPATVGNLRRRLLEEPLPKQVTVREITRTRQLNWRHYELFKAAINLGLVHAPAFWNQPDPEHESGLKANYASGEAELELRFLEEKNGAVNHPTSGPVQTKDIADSMCEVVVGLIGDEIASALGQALDAVGVGGVGALGTDPTRHQTPPDQRSAAIGDMFNRASSRSMSQTQIGRGMRRR